MRYTFDNNEHSSLIIYAANEDRHAIAELIRSQGTTTRSEMDALESLLADSDLEWIRPEEIGALTDAPILGIRKGYMDVDDAENPENELAPNRPFEAAQEVERAWGFMDYQVRSFLTDLRDKGKAVFVS